ncbi:YppG family protein [Siminovitchia sediminis]|uniref:YppG family protein n=1 Tax=Siminovitchia sediminis TaxID=1274353 RepID=A0ABW4KGW1_9BACI
MYAANRSSGYFPPYSNLSATYYPASGMYPGNGYYPPFPPVSYSQQPYPGGKGGSHISNQLFHNPLQKEEDIESGYQYHGGFVHPYPLPGPLPKMQSSYMSQFLNSFKSQSGSLDLNKMMDTAGQMMNALTQVSNMAKGLGGLFKGS